MMIGFAIALVAGAVGVAVPADDARPVRLEIVRHPDTLDIKVLGDAAPTADARFDLEVQSKGTGGTTRTAQSGTNRAGQVGGTLLTSTIRTSGLAGWTARLRVTIGDRQYEMTEAS